MKFNRVGGWGVVGKDRQTGESLGQALQYIGIALRNPGMAVEVVDHFGSMKSNRFLFETVGSLIADLGLQYIVSNRANLTITYHLYGREESPDKVLYHGRPMRKSDQQAVIIDGVTYVPD